ncbi:hypothetical protein HYT56_00140 [Candidatus Woesearchaeota archaeon]|nr:hypothetical protein [Candidatus Woesearchaeota archaeon]
MPHQCIKCNRILPEGNKDILSGCSNCGSKFFFFIKKEHMPEAEEELEKLSDEDRKKIEQDVFEMIGVEDDKPVILDFESIRALRPGKFEIDIRHLFKGEPLVYKMADGKYIIDIPSSFQMRKKK